jgi:hypothetical protein
MTLTELEQLKIDLTFDWLRARLEHVRRNHTSRYIQPLPDELGPFVRSRRRQALARAELARLLAEVEGPSAAGMYRFGIDQAIRWLGGDSELLTQKIGEWIRRGPRFQQLALSFVNTSDWKVFTKRAKVVLDARPNDPEIPRFLIGMRRYPGSWIGSMEPYLRSQADAFRQWTRSLDARLRALGAEAVATYERLAQEAVAEERSRRESI